MKKALGIILAALVFGGVAGATILGVTKAAGVNLRQEASVETAAESTEAETEAAVLSESSAEALKEETEAETKAEAETEENKEKKTVSGTAAVLDVSGIVEEAMPQVVSITNTMVIRQQGYSNIFDYFYGGGMVQQEYEVPASGSGVILDKTDEELLIVTNNHVVQDSKELSVTFIDGSTVNAAIKGADSDIDIAVIAVPLKDISDETMKEIKVATLHDSEDLKVGQGVIAIGNALGYGQTVTVGYISALDREIQAEDSVYSNLIQVDAAINPGNSGGALINMDGEVIGINVAKLSNTAVEGIGYSIPIYKAKEVISDLSNVKTKVELDEDKQGRLGIYMNTVSAENAAALSIPAGVIIKGFSDEAIEGYTDADVQESPARKAGLLKNDIITKFDNQSVKNAEGLASLVKYYEEGTEVDVTVQRLENGVYNEKVITVTLGSKKDPKIKAVNDDKDQKNAQAETDQKEQQDQQESEQQDDAGANGEGSGELNPQDEIYDLFREFLDQYR